MATAPRLGLMPARKIGSAPDNGGMSEYPIASGYATALGCGDPVKLHTDGTIIVATNGADLLGTFQGCLYLDSSSKLQYQKYWPASQTSTNPTPTALVNDSPNALFNVKCDGPIPVLKVGDIYALNLSAPDSAIGHSTVTLKTTVVKTGATDITGATDMGATVTNIDDADAFNISTSVNTTPVTITIGTTETTAHFLAQLNAVPGISATTNGSGYLVVTATDGGSLILADGSGTPLADSTILAVAGTYVGTVAAGSGSCKVTRIIDTDNYVVEVDLVNHIYRHNAA